MRIKNNMKKFITAIISVLILSGITVSASDLIIESKQQSFNEEDNKIKFDGDVNVSVDDLKVVGSSADVNITEDQKLDTATFYDKPYAFEIKKNKKREVKANILKVSLITKIIRAEGDTQSIVFEGKTPIVVINADVQEYDTKSGVMTATGAVTMKYKDIESFSNSAEITTDKNGDLKKLVLIGNAKVKQENNESLADKFVYEATTGNLTAYGNTTSNAVMDDGSKLVLKSNYQEYNQKKSVFNASGNVRIWYNELQSNGNTYSDGYYTGNVTITNLNNENDNNSNNNNNKMSNSNFNLTNLDTNNINFDLSSNIKSEIMNDNNINENENNFFPNEILKQIRAVEYTYFAVKKKNEKIKEYKKQINRTKNFSVQLVSKLDYYRDEDKDNNKINNNNNSNDANKFKKRKTGSENREVMNEMNDLIKNLNLMNPNMNNNININNINNNININHANLAEIISQQHKLNPKKNINNTKPRINQINNNLIKNSKKNSNHYINLNNNFNNINNLNYNTNTATTTNTTANKTNNISSSKKNNYSTNINSITNNPIITSKTPNSIINHKNKPSYKKVVLNNTKPILNNLDLNINENIQNLQKVKTKAQIKINYRHISNSNLTQTNSNNNSNKRKRKNNSVIINNSNKRKDPKINFYHFNTNNTNSNNTNTNNNSTHNTNDMNILKNNIKNIIKQIPSLYKNNPLTTKNKKISMANIIKKNNLINNNNGNNIPKKKNSYNNININTGNKFSTLNTLQKNNLIKFYRANHQTEAINKLKQQTYLGVYFIYAEKIKNHFIFRGIYKKSVSDLNYICNKIYSGPSAPVSLNYEKFFIFTENNKMELIQTKLSSISVFNLNKSIILVKNE